MSDAINNDENTVSVAKVLSENDPTLDENTQKDVFEPLNIMATVGNKSDSTSSKTKKTRKDIVRELPKTHVLKVASETNVNKLAKTIVGCIKDFLKCELLCIGAGPTWVAVKAYMVAKGELAKYNYRLKLEAGFIEPRPVIDGMERTGARILLVAEDINP